MSQRGNKENCKMLQGGTSQKSQWLMQAVAPFSFNLFANFYQKHVADNYFPFKKIFA